MREILRSNDAVLISFAEAMSRALERISAQLQQQVLSRHRADVAEVTAHANASLPLINAENVVGIADGQDRAELLRVQPEDHFRQLRIQGVQLRVEVDYERLYFGFRLEGEKWRWLPQQFDASILSDEANTPGSPNFTGAFVGMCCQDLAGTAEPADFDYFDYRERTFRADPLVD
jgi:hypothetical protein